MRRLGMNLIEDVTRAPSVQEEDIASVCFCNCDVYDVIEADVEPCIFSRLLLSVVFALLSV
jgi:hypothetical protein